jgi:predicted acylesterase/phospholipase RssA
MSPTRRGLVLSGGGALGAYQAGVLVAIHESGLRFDVIAATSIGVLHALVYNRGDEMLHGLRDTWIDTVEWVEPFAARRLLTLRNPFSYGEALDRIFGRYRDSQPPATEEGQVPIIVFLTEAGTRRSVSFNTAEDGLDRDERELVYRAAAAIPALGDRAIEIRGTRYFDGGFTNNLPLGALLDRDDLDEVWAITPFRKRRRKRKPKPRPATDKQLFVIRPDPDDRSNALRAYHAVLFSVDNIRRLYDRGYADGLAAGRRYLDG